MLGSLEKRGVPTLRSHTHGLHHPHLSYVVLLQWELAAVRDDTRMDHLFHLHGFFFQVLEHDGVPAESLSWEDTVNIPARSSVRIAWIPDDRPGSWMYHCHILEHHAAGMMAHFDVVR